MQKKLRIAIVCDSIDTTLGGSYMSAERFAAGLTEFGHEIIWITSKFKDESRRKDFAYAKIYEFPSLRPMGPQNVRFAYMSVSALCNIFEKEKIDIIYNIHPSIIGWQSIRAAKRLKLPIVSHSHIRPDSIAPGAPKCIHTIIKKVVASIYRRCDGLISVTKFAQNIFADMKLQNKEIVISNGVDREIFYPQEHTKKEYFNILYVGTFFPYKNVALLINAIHLLKKQQKFSAHMHCTIVGDGSPKERKALQDLVRTHGLSESITFTGRLATAEVVKQCQQASVFVLPSLYELEGMVVLEAMACGCPLLISNSPNSAAKDFVHNNGYTFDYKDPQDLADKIYKLSTNPDLCELMRKISIEEAQNFSFTLSVQKLESFLASFVRT